MQQAFVCVSLPSLSILFLRAVQRVMGIYRLFLCNALICHSLPILFWMNIWVVSNWSANDDPANPCPSLKVYYRGIQYSFDIFLLVSTFYSVSFFILLFSARLFLYFRCDPSQDGTDFIFPPSMTDLIF